MRFMIKTGADLSVFACDKPQARMSAADFLLAPEVQKLLKIVFAAPASKFSVAQLAKMARLEVDEVERTQEHLVKSGILTRHEPKADEAGTVEANMSFVFYDELRSIALKSFAAAEPIRAMLRSKFKDSVLRAFVLGEDKDATVQLVVVYGQLVPDEAKMSIACQKLSASIGRHLDVHVISGARYAALTPRDELGAKLADHRAVEIIGQGETKAKPAAEREGLLQIARKKLSALAR
ncbi:hypothetical protein [Variovorax saccharolyticus]|uniref:hypothetical protein n=1 Tax=Variovorax saccharolyticus TaxID=3053516 RepID=UPI00257608BE|nr:hypothetical protein [Variovorax sp. J22R187]MDM0021361.1 hypothetical protein [Variovorax sp. J22R187]